MSKSDTNDLAADKSRARSLARKKRKKAAHSAAAAELIGQFPAGRFRSMAVAGFWPIHDEIDVRPLMSALHSSGNPLALPCLGPVGTPLTFRRYVPGGDLVSAGYGTSEPPPSAPLVTPDLVLVPLLAFTREGTRLGYGGGFYDRTLAGLRKNGDVFACGIAYAGQETDFIPVGQYDENLDGMLTEAEFITF